MKKNKGMADTVKIVTDILKGFVFIYGVNIVLYGHLSPGGGFAGGLIIAFLLILMFLVFGREEIFRRFTRKTAHTLETAAAVVFLLLVSFEVIPGGIGLLEFFENLITGRTFRLVSGGRIPLGNIALGVKVAASIFLVFTVLAIFRETEKEEEKDDK